MTLESAAVEFLRASVAWAAAKHSTRNMRCEHANMNPDDPFAPCPDEHGRTYTEDWCANCRTREPLMAERRAALKTYQQARRRALRALQQETT